MIYRIVLLAAAILIVALLPVYEKKLNSLIESAKGRLLSGAAEAHPNLQPKEDDIVSNKGKWRLLMIGYAVFILFMIFATVSIVTLNTKINNISTATEDILDRLSVLEEND